MYVYTFFNENRSIINLITFFKCLKLITFMKIKNILENYNFTSLDGLPPSVPI